MTLPSRNHDRFVENFSESLTFALKPNQSGTTCSGDILSTVHRGGQQIFKSDKIEERLRVYSETSETETDRLLHQSSTAITREIGNKFGVGDCGFLGVFANAKLGVSVNTTRNQTSVTRFNHFQHKVVRREWRLPSLKELQTDYVSDDFFRTLETVDEAIKFQDSNGYYFIEEIEFGGSVTYSSHTSYSSEARAIESEQSAKAAFLEVVEAAKISNRWKIETKQENGMQSSATRVCGGDDDVATLQEWERSLDDPNNLHIVKVVLKPIYHLTTKKTTKEMLKRALMMKTNEYLKYCFELKNSIIFHSNVNGTDASVSIECRQAMIENGIVFFNIFKHPSGEKVKGDKKYQVVYRRCEGGQAICTLKKKRRPYRSDKFLCSRNQSLDDGWDGNDLEAEWILKDLPVPDESNILWATLLRVASGLKSSQERISGMLPSPGAFLPERETIQRWRPNIPWESILQATSDIRASKLYCAAKSQCLALHANARSQCLALHANARSQCLALNDNIDRSLLAAFPKHSTEVKLFLFSTMALTLILCPIGALRFLNRKEQTRVEKLGGAVTQFRQWFNGIVPKLSEVLENSLVGNAHS